MRNIVKAFTSLMKAIGDYILSHPYWIGGIISTILVGAIQDYRKEGKKS